MTKLFIQFNIVQHGAQNFLCKECDVESIALRDAENKQNVILANVFGINLFLNQLRTNRCKKLRKKKEKKTESKRPV